MRAPLRLLLPAAAALLAVIAVAAIVLGTSTKGSANRSFVGAVLPAGVRAPGFTLTDQAGRTVSLSADRGRVVVLVFLDSTCRTCVLVAQQVRGALDELAGPVGAPAGTSTTPPKGVSVIFVSTDPTLDTRADVQRLLSETSLSGRVKYLTGAPAALRATWRAYDLPTTDSDTKASYPATSVLLIDGRGVERVELGLEQLTPESLAHDVRGLAAG